MGEGLYSSRLGSLKAYMGAFAEHHGLIKAPVVNRSTAPTEPTNIDLNSIAAPNTGGDTNRMMQ